VIAADSKMGLIVCLQANLLHALLYVKIVKLLVMKLVMMEIMLTDKGVL